MDWALISSLATAGGTLVLGIATFASVRSANRAARAAEGSLLAGLRPLLVASRLQDPPEKVSFADNHWLRVEGGHGVAEVTADAIYLAISVRNVGSGIGVLHGWMLLEERPGVDVKAPNPAHFRRLTRDIYVPAGDIGFWQGAFRDPGSNEFTRASQVIGNHQPFWINVLYGDFEGGQRSITLFGFVPVREQEWLATVGRHWNLDRPSPR
jgi:hypothetical protein